MNGKSRSALWARLACGGFLLPLILTGCGGSSSSSSSASAAPTANTPAIIGQGSSIFTGSDYILSLLPTGAATFNLFSAVPSNGSPVPGPTQTGTVSAALTAQFFKDLTAAMPLQNLPESNSGGSVGSTTVTLQYAGQKGYLNDLSDAREQALETDVLAIAKALGLPQY